MKKNKQSTLKQSSLQSNSVENQENLNPKAVSFPQQQALTAQEQRPNNEAAKKSEKIHIKQKRSTVETAETLTISKFAEESQANKKISQDKTLMPQAVINYLMNSKVSSSQLKQRLSDIQSTSDKLKNQLKGSQPNRVDI